MSIRHTRAMVRAALDGTLARSRARPIRTSACRCRNACPDVPGDVLNPKNTWKDKKAYDSAARDVAQRFEANFQQFESHVDGKVKQGGNPRRRLITAAATTECDDGRRRGTFRIGLACAI